jgi:hypothetical protein
MAAVIIALVVGVVTGGRVSRSVCDCPPAFPHGHSWSGYATPQIGIPSVIRTALPGVLQLEG